MYRVKAAWDGQLHGFLRLLDNLHPEQVKCCSDRELGLVKQEEDAEDILEDLCEEDDGGGEVLGTGKAGVAHTQNMDTRLEGQNGQDHQPQPATRHVAHHYGPMV